MTVASPKPLRRRRFRPAAGVLAATGSATAFGVTIVVQRRLASRGLSVTAALAVRCGIAGAVLLAYLALRGAPLRPVRGERSRALLLGAIGYAGEAALFYLALQRGSAAAVAGPMRLSTTARRRVRRALPWRP